MVMISSNPGHTAMDMPLSLNDTAITTRVNHTLHCLCVCVCVYVPFLEYISIYYTPLHNDMIVVTFFLLSSSSFQAETGSYSISLGNSVFA